MVAVEEVPADQTNKYGILDVDFDDGRLARASGLVEKPAPEDAPSRLARPCIRSPAPPRALPKSGRHPAV